MSTREVINHSRVPVKHLGHAGKAAQGEEDQKGLRLLVDLGRAKVVNPPL